MGRQSVRQIYPGFELFLKPRIRDQTAGIAAAGHEEPAALRRLPPQKNAIQTATQTAIAELRLYRRNPEDFELGIWPGGFYWNIGPGAASTAAQALGASFPISFRALGNWAVSGKSGQEQARPAGLGGSPNIDVRVKNLRIKPALLNDLLPEDPVIRRPVLRLEGGAMRGHLRLSGRALNPAMDGMLKLQDISLVSPYFPGELPRLNAELMFQGHVIMARPFGIAFREGRLYSPGYEAAYLRHESLRVKRYYLGLRAEGAQGLPVFYDAYGIRYRANARGQAVLEGDAQGGKLRAELEFERLLMQGSETYKQIPQSSLGNRGWQGYPFSLDIRAKTGRSARLAYPSETNPVFRAQLNPRDELRLSYDGSSREGSLEGRVELYNGKLYLLGNQMELRKGELRFAENFRDFSPQISLLFTLPTYDAEGQSIQINMDYEGELASLAERGWAPTLSSQPALPQQQLRYLLAAQFNAGGSAGSTANISGPQNQLFSGVLSHLGSSVVLKPIEEIIRKGFQFDEVRLETSLIGNLLQDYLNSAVRAPGRKEGNWAQYLDNTRLSMGRYIDRNNTILFLLNIDLLYKPQDTSPVLFMRDGLQVVPGFGFKFHTPLLDITWNVGLAHYNDFFITDSSLLLEWSLSTFLNRRRAVFEEPNREWSEAGVMSDELVPYNEE